MLRAVAWSAWVKHLSIIILIHNVCTVPISPLPFAFASSVTSLRNSSRLLLTPLDCMCAYQRIVCIRNIAFKFTHIYLETGHRFSILSAPLCLRLLIFIRKFLFFLCTNYALFFSDSVAICRIPIFRISVATCSIICCLPILAEFFNTKVIWGKTQKQFL